MSTEATTKQLYWRVRSVAAYGTSAFSPVGFFYIPVPVSGDAETPTILKQIETAILRRLQDRGLDVVEVDIKVPQLMLTANPSVSCRVSDIQFEAVTQTTYKGNTTVTIFLALKNLAGDKQRRQTAYPLVMGIIGYLSGQTLGLPIKALSPGTARETTPEILEKAGLTIYELEFKTRFYIDVEELPAAQLLELGIRYYLKPGDNVPDAEDTVTVENITI